MKSKVTEYKKKKIIDLIKRMSENEVEQLSKHLNVKINPSLTGQ
jgi:hypothetical protein